MRKGRGMRRGDTKKKRKGKGRRRGDTIRKSVRRRGQGIR